MKKYNKLYLLLVMVLLPVSAVFSQTSYRVADARKTVYSDPSVQEAVDFLKDRLPGLIAVDRDKAIGEYLTHFESLNKLDEMDVLYLVGHFYAVVDDAKTAIPYFEMLINDPGLGEDARRMLNLLLYYRAVSYLQKDDKQKSQDFLEDILNLFPTGKYYPTYMFLWADLISEGDRHAEVNKYLESYNANRDWIQSNFKPRKTAIIQRISNLDLNKYYKNPGDMEYLVLEEEINSIKVDLQTLYNELKAVPGLLTTDSLDRISNEELKLLEELRLQLKAYHSPPPLDLDMLASSEYSGSEMRAYNNYREGAVLLKQLKGTSEYYGKVLDIMDRIFEKRYDLFVSEDESVAGRSYSDMEMKRLFDIEKNIDIYNEVIRSIDELMADPGYLSLNVDLGPERQEYVEKLADLQNRKERYIAFRKHQDNIEEEIFNELLDEYYALNREKNMLDELLPEVEEVMISMIKEHYPKDQQQVINNQQMLAGSVASGNLAMDDNLNSFMANLDFIYLQLDYRNLRYREQQRQAQIGNISDEELQSQYDQILADKATLLQRHREFVAQNPVFLALEQPSGGYLLNNTIIYYNMAELQYAVDLDQPELALAYYRKVLEIEPDFFLRDYALYNIAYISSESTSNALDAQIAEFRTKNPNQERPARLKYKASDFREALDAYGEIANSGKYIESPLYYEALYRLGVLNFVIGSDADEPVESYAQAKKYFDTLVENPNSNYTYEALYQRGWVNMNQGDETSLKLALGDFVSLIKAVDNSKVANQYLSIDYKSNSIDNIAYTLVALDGINFTEESKGVAEVQVALADYQDLHVKNSILDKAAGLKADMQAPLQAIDYMQLRLIASPLELNNPTIVDSIITLYHTPGLQLRPGADLASIRSSKYDFMLSNYNTKSEWYRQNIFNRDISDPAIRKQLLILDNAYEQVRVRLYNDLVTSMSEESLSAYNEHLKRYGEFRTLYGDNLTQWQTDVDKADALISTLVAEKRNTDIDSYYAAQSLWSYNLKYPDNPEYFNNEGLAYKYAQGVYTHLDTAFAEPGFTPAAGLPVDENALYVFYRDASIKFYNVLNIPKYSSPANKQNSVQLMMDLAEIENNRGMSTQAKSRYSSLLAEDNLLDNSARRSIYLNLANIEEGARNFPRAEEYYREAKKYASNEQDAAEIDHQIKLQIQNSYEQAEQRGNYALVANEYIRLSDEFKDQSEKYIAYRYQASEAYIKARQYQKAIDLKLDIAKRKNTLEDKYFLYYESWTTADSLMNDSVQADKLKSELISMYPSSNVAFNLRVSAIEELKSISSQRENAAQMYIILHDEVRSGTIDNGNVAPEDIYLWALEIYRDTNNKDKIIELLTYFTKTYPEHEQNVVFMTVLADEYLARRDKDNFELYARLIYEKDNTKYERYLTTAKQKLGKIAFDFDSAFLNKDWELAFQQRDAFKKLEAQYKQEGLIMDNTLAYEAFTFAEKEYTELQAKLAFLRDFDRQILAIERGDFLNSSANQLIMVNSNTTWKKHLFGGTPNRVPALQARTELESRKIVRLMEQKGSDYLDPARRLHALSLLCRLNDFAADVTDTQIKKYIQIAYEMLPYKDRSQYSEAMYNDLINNELMPYANEYINQYQDTSTGIYKEIYANYSIAGYSDIYTQRAENQLRTRNQFPAYKVMKYPLDSGWNVSMQIPDGGITQRNVKVSETSSPKGIELGSCTILADQSLIITRDFSSRIAPEFMFLHMVYPYDPELFFNGEKVELVYVPVDTLIANKSISTVYSIRIDGKLWKEGTNTFQGTFPNNATEPIPFNFGAVLFYDKQKLANGIPSETIKIPSDKQWLLVTKNPETGDEVKSYATPVNFDIPINRDEYLVDSSAQPIWFNEASTDIQNDAVFEVSFDVDTQYREGYVDFVAPDIAAVYLNGKLLGENIPMSYDAEPFVVYPSRVILPPDSIISGQNTLRIMVSNMSPYRGMLAELSITKAVKE